MFNDRKRSLDAHSLRGAGTGSRLTITSEYLENHGWKIEKTQKGFKWTNAEGQAFYSSKSVEQFIRTQQQSGILSDESDNDYLPSASSDDCLSSPEKSSTKKWQKINERDSEMSIKLPVKFHIAMTSQLEDFVEQINMTRQCNVQSGCKGKLVPVKIQDKGMGGAVKVNFACSGCGTEIHYASSQLALAHNQRNCVSLATALCFLVYGQGYHTYHKVLKLGMGIDVLARPNFQKIIELAYPHVKTILDSMCEKAKAHMQSKPATELGSWQRAVTTSDGCWLIRGFHSQCCTFVLLDFLSGGILYYGHLCMRGRKSICETDLWKGTSKSAEGHLAYLLFKKGKEEGLNIALNWQDQDSTAEISFRSIFTDGELNRVMLCGGHVGRSHGNNLKEYKGKKVVDKGFIDKHKKNHPAISHAKCCCEGKKHSKSCGCLSDDFIASSKRNHFSALKQSGNSAVEYGRRMKVLGKYHCRDIHQWIDEDGREDECGFHPLVVCSCGSCLSKSTDNAGSDSDDDSKDDDSNSGDSNDDGGNDGSNGGDSNDDVSNCGDSSDDDRNDDDSNSGDTSDDSDGESDGGDSNDDSNDDDSEEEDPKLNCSGKPFATRKILSCELHALLYEIECMRIARKANDIVHEEMGRGHSSLPESKFNVLTRFRTKNVNLHQLHYEFITNVGLCQSNMTFMFKNCGPSYHWMKELYDLLHLPTPDGLEDIWKSENEQRMKRLTKKRTEAAKSARARKKQERMQESLQRKKFVQRQKIIHSYGNEDEDLGEVELLEEAEKQLNKRSSSTRKQPKSTNAPRGARVNVGGQLCKCGSKEHSRISHKSCPLNKKSKKN